MSKLNNSWFSAWFSSNSEDSGVIGSSSRDMLLNGTVIILPVSMSTSTSLSRRRECVFTFLESEKPPSVKAFSNSLLASKFNTSCFSVLALASILSSVDEKSDVPER